jgi:hypothetical protein
LGGLHVFHVIPIPHPWERHLTQTRITFSGPSVV